MTCTLKSQAKRAVRFARMFVIASMTLLASGSIATAQLIDVNDDDAASPTLAGWTATDATNINGVTFTAVGQNTVADPPVDVVIDDRFRAGPYGGPQDDMWQDFIFANGSNSEGSGMDVTVAGFTPNSVYNVKVYAFDTDSNADRSMTWNRTVLTFDGGDPDPTTLDEYNVTVPAIADASGTLLLRGRTNLAASNNNQHNVFMNGFEVQNTLETLSLEVNTTTGLTKIKNAHNTSIDLNYYEILSSNNSLDVSTWVPLDTTPGGTVSENGWEAAGGSSSSILSETNLRGMSSLGNTDELAIGAAFGGGMEDLQFWYAAPDGNLVPGPVTYVTGSDEILGDYDNSGQVGQGDLDLVLLNWGQTAPPVPNGWVNEQPNGLIGQSALDGVLLNWGNTSLSASVNAVPEPTAWALFCLGNLGLLMRRRSEC